MLDKPSALPEMELPLSADPQRSFTLSSGYYTDPAVYEREKGAIFYRSWQYVAHRASFAQPGDYVTLRICDQNVFVIRGEDGELRGFYNVCRHRAHELLQGQGNVASVITCPYHAWTYEKDGRLRGAPNSGARPGFDKCAFGLRQVRVEEFLGFVFVNLDDAAESLAAQAGDLADDIRARVPFIDDLNSSGTRIADARIKAGWKVVVDNYVECYHCNHAHPAFASLICMDAYQLDTFGIWSRQLGDEIRIENDAYPVDPDDGFQGSAFWFLWPNITFNVLPGGNDLSVFSVRPVAHDMCDFDGDVFTADGVDRAARREYGANVLGPEDTALCESVQRGLRSMGYDQGPIIIDPEHAGTSEQAIHHFHRLVQAALAE